MVARVDRWLRVAVGQDRVGLGSEYPTPVNFRARNDDPAEFVRQGHDEQNATQNQASERSAISEVVYGTITILAVILALEEHSSGPWQVTFTIVGTTYALAFARAYADLIAETLHRGRRLGRSDLLLIWREARPVMVYSQLPTLVFVLSAVGLLPLGLSFTIAETVGVLVLLFAGYRVGRRVGASRLRSLLSGLAIASVGGLVILLKVLTH